MTGKRTFRMYLAPKYLGEGFICFFVNLHKILLFTLFMLVTSLPIVTLGASLIAYNSVLREIAQDNKVPVGDYFRIFSKKILCGIPYSAVFALVVFLLSIPVGESFIYYCLQFCAVLLFCLTMYYPVTAHSQNNVPKLFTLSVLYAFGHLLQTLMMVCVAVIIFMIAAYTSEILMILFFPVFYFSVNRIVLANNAEIDREEKESGQTEK